MQEFRKLIKEKKEKKRKKGVAQHQQLVTTFIFATAKNRYKLHPGITGEKLPNYQRK